MDGTAETPARNLVDGVDVDAVARTTLGCPGVEDLHGGFPEVATYLPGRRLVGIRVDRHAVEVQVRAAWNVPARQIGVGIQTAVLPLAGGRNVDVIIADLGDPPDARQHAVRAPDVGGQRDAAVEATAPAETEQTQTIDRLTVSDQAAEKPGWPPMAN